MTQWSLVLRKEVGNTNDANYPETKRSHLYPERQCDIIFYFAIFFTQTQVICSSFYLNINPRSQKMTHFLQDLFLQSVPGHSALQVQYKRQTKSEMLILLLGRNEQISIFFKREYFILKYLFAWCPVQALLHTKRIIFSGPRFLLGDAVKGVIAPCIKDDVLLISVPYLKLLWFRFARRLPGKKKDEKL